MTSGGAMVSRWPSTQDRVLSARGLDTLIRQLEGLAVVREGWLDRRHGLRVSSLQAAGRCSQPVVAAAACR